MTDEHERYACYQLRLANVSEADESALVREVLHDADPVMADSAIVGHLNLRAAALLTDPAYPAWAARMAEVLEGCPFPARRLEEWTLLRALALGEDRPDAEVTGASDWLQRQASARLDTVGPLTLLARHGRTRRVRVAAGRRLKALERR